MSVNEPVHEWFTKQPPAKVEDLLDVMEQCPDAPEWRVTSDLYAAAWLHVVRSVAYASFNGLNLRLEEFDPEYLLVKYRGGVHPAIVAGKLARIQVAAEQLAERVEAWLARTTS